MSLRIFIFLYFLSFLHSGYSQIINLSNNNTSSTNPYLFYHNGEMFVFWNDGTDHNNIYFKYKSNNQWGNTQIIQTSGNSKITSISPDSATGIHLTWVDVDSNSNRLM